MKIEHECPQCGAPIILEETDRLLSCHFCRARLYIQAGDCFRYYFPPGEDVNENILFVPYWRFRGMHFLCITDRIEQGLIDKTFPAVTSQSIKPSLGLRPGSLKLRFVQSSDRRTFLQPQFSFKESYAATEQKVSFKPVAVHKDLTIFESLDIPITETIIKEEVLFYESFIAETLSLLYTPVYIRDAVIYDAILNEPLPGAIGDGGFDLRGAGNNPGITFLPTMCPNCGWDMIAERDSCILVCTHCNTLWETTAGGFRRTDFSVVRAAKDDTGLMYLPFWRMKINVQGIDLKSYADLVRYANLPKSIQQGWENAGLYFWAPAFKVPPSTFLMLSKQITLLQPDREIDDTLPGSQVYPVNLSKQEAIESVKITLANMSARKKTLFPRLNDISAGCVESLLVYYPFTETNTELIQEELRLGIQKNALKLGQNI
jgi:ribosomal protein L37AE/L43A